MGLCTCSEGSDTGGQGASPHHGPRPPREDVLRAAQSLSVGVGFKPRPTCLQRPSPFASPCGLLDRGQLSGWEQCPGVGSSGSE